MVAAGKLGKKSGEGFYVWKDGKPQKAEPETPWDKASSSGSAASWSIR